MKIYKALLALLCLVTLSGEPVALASGVKDAKTVRDVYNLMYREQQRVGGAYLLLNATGSIGSAGPPDGRDADAPLIHLRDLPEDPGGAAGGEWVVLVPVKDSNAFLQRLAADGALNTRVAGVLVDDSDPPAAYSTVPSFPGAQYAPYPAGGYAWNPAGSYSSQQRWPVPVMLLGQDLARDARDRADYNARRGHRGRAYHARISMPMSASVDSNSSSCLAAKRCQPLGGFSVWGALPPIPAGQNITKPTLLVLAQVDSIDAFHDSVQGADAPLSGLVAMLSAMSLLGAPADAADAGAAGGGVAAPPSGFTRQLVFVALVGEPWGYMGSRAFLWELERGGVTVQGLDLVLIDQVLEIGPVGQALSGSPPAARLFAHAQKGAAFGNTSGLVLALQEAAEQLPTALQTVVAPASSSNPGIPPSSLMSFLRIKPSIAGVVLTEFDRSYSNPYQGSRFDNASRFDAGSVVRAAAVVAAALHRLAGGGSGGLQINATLLEARVSAFASCLVMPDPGLACPAAAAVMIPGYTEADGVRSYAPKHYVGVLQVVHPDPQNPFLKDDVSRFLWNTMALATAGGAEGSACDPSKNKCPDGQVCAGWKRGDSDPALLGRCVNATVLYVPSLSTRVACAQCDDIFGAFEWRETAEADAWAARHGWPADPMWAESNWPTGAPFLQLYLAKPYKTRVAVLVAGVTITVASLAISLGARRMFEQHLKSS